jgi:proteasome accessory factor B
VEPYGLFLREGRWYLVGRDLGRDALRTYALARLTGLRVNPARPKSPDFERPAEFEVASYVTLPFQYGPEDGARFEAVLRFSGEHAWRAERLASGQGELEPQTDGATLWRVPAADGDALARWVVENGPGIEILEPASARDALLGGLEEVALIHGG